MALPGVTQPGRGECKETKAQRGHGAYPKTQQLKGYGPAREAWSSPGVVPLCWVHHARARASRCSFKGAPHSTPQPVNHCPHSWEVKFSASECSNASGEDKADGSHTPYSEFMSW